MKPIPLKYQNCVYAKDQPEYLPLPARKTTDGIVTTCWQMSLVERLKATCTGKVYVSQMTFNAPLQPLKVSTWDDIQAFQEFCDLRKKL